MLYLVPTPLGNLEDMTFRAVRVLREADRILAEDTRKTHVLLQHFEIDNQLQSFHAHNEHHQLERVLALLEEGQHIALVSDAGSPGISDPGFLLVRACVERAIPISALPGPTAIIPAVASSGLPCDRFYFEGFLPAKKGRNKRLQYLSKVKETIVLYESPYKLIKTLQQLSEFLGPDRNCCVAKEISKVHETFYRGTVLDVAQTLVQLPKIKGEYTIVIAGADK